MAKKRIQRTDQIFRESEAVATLLAEREGAMQRSIPVESLVPNRFNPRQTYSKEALDELIQSMEEHGFIGALDGRELPDGRVELAYGSRRLLAARAASIQMIPVFLHEWDDNQIRFVSLVENLIREDLTPTEEAETVGQMNEELGLSVREIARKTGKPKSWVEDRLALYRAPQDVKEMVTARSDALRAARFIARVPDEASRQALVERVIREELTTRQVQQAVQQVVGEETPIEEAVAAVTTEEEPEPPPTAPPQVSALRQPFDQAQDEAQDTAEVRSEPPPPPAPPPVSPVRQAQDVEPVSSGERTTEPVEATGVQPVRGEISPSRFVIEVNRTLARFDLEAFQDEELKELRDHLQQLIDKASQLLERVDARLQSQ